MTTRKTSKVWNYFELEGNGKVLCKLCNVKLAYNNFTGAMRNPIQYTYALAWSLAKPNVNHVIHYNLPLRSAILSAPSIPLNEDPLRWWCGISRLFSNCLLACSYFSACL